MGQVYRDVVLSNLEMDLRPATGDIPLRPLVHSLSIDLTNAALAQAVQAVLHMGKSRTSIEVEFEEAAFVPGGAEVTVTAGLNRFLRAKATAVIGVSASASPLIAVRIVEIRTLGKLPVESVAAPFIEKALAKATQRQGLSLDPAHSRGVLIDPQVVLQDLGIPLDLAQPGGWTVESSGGHLRLRYESA